MRIAILLLTTLLTFTLLAPPAARGAGPTPDSRLQWFRDAKLGIFIHWGIYAVKGIDESWSFHNGSISYPDYMAQTGGFTASAYDPARWADLIANAGARYAVLTAKHHDGVALWDTDCGDLDVIERTPARRDLVAPFVRALRDRDLRVGLYYSLIDWSHPDYPGFLRDAPRYEHDPDRWDSFARFNLAQIEELSRRFDPDLVWFDGDWEHSAEEWRAPEIRRRLLDRNPEVVINSRLKGHGDYATPEQGLPITRPEQSPWELCLTMNDSWGYQPNDHDYKSVNQIIRLFVDCLSMGGNLLLDIGPRADGTIVPEQAAILEGLGRWTRKHAAAVYGTRAGLPCGHFHGPTALAANHEILYLYLPHRPNGPVALKGLRNRINRIWVVGDGTKLGWDIKMKQYWSEVPGVVYIDVPDTVLDPEVTVLAVLLDGPVSLYREDGQTIESN